MFSITQSGDFKNLEKSLEKIKNFYSSPYFDEYGKKGVQELSSATPVDTGLAASQWGYEVERNAKHIVVQWINDDIENGFPVAIQRQYGHGTGTGGYVEGIDYINPAAGPVMDEMTDVIWKEVFE